MFRDINARSEDCDLKVVEIPIDVRYDTFGTSSKNPVSHGFGVPGSDSKERRMEGDDEPGLWHRNQ